jgi:TonB family protein
MVWMALLLLSLALGPRAGASAPEGVVVPPRPVDLPEPDMPAGLVAVDANVGLVLTIAIDGAVTDVSVQSGVGDPWDTIAVATAKRYRFEPATVDGKPVAVKVPFTFVFRRPARRGRSVEAVRERSALEPAPGYVYAGELVERGTRTPQVGVPVLIRDTRTAREWEVLTDADGRFVIYGLPRGKLKLDVFTGGFEPLERDVTVRTTDADAAVADAERFYLSPGGLSAYRTVVREKREPGAATVIELTEDELRKVAGTLGDPTRVVASLPGVARSPFGLGYFIVRGAQLDNTGFFIDGHPAVFLYHLLGGPGVIHPQLVGSLNFYPGGYPAQYGRVASAAIAVETKDPPTDRWHLDLEMDLFKAGVLFSVPFDDGKGIVSVALRRSYFELILPLINDDINVNYTDYQLRTTYRISDRVKARFVALGAIDNVSVNNVETGDGAGTSSTDFGLGFHRLNLAFDIELAKDLTLLESAAFEYDVIDNRRVAEGDDPIDVVSSAWFAQLLSIAKWRPAPGYQLDAGLDLFYLSARADLSIPAAPPLGDPRPPVFDPVIVSADIDAPYLQVAPFLSAQLEIAKGLKLLPGLRLNVDNYGDAWRVTADPKLAVRWQVDEDWTLKAMGAMAHQPPQIFQIAAPFGDPGIPPVQGMQASAGFEWTPGSDWLVSVEGFYQYLDRIVRPSNRLASEDGEFGRLYWDPDVEGRAYGLEVLIRKEFGGWVYGWLSYTLSRAERLRPPEQWDLYEVDQTHVLNLAWTFRLGREWSLSTRFQLTSGNPYYPIVGSTFDGDENEYVPIYAARRSRLEPFHRLDLRLDKTFRYEDWMLEVFLDIQNVYNAQNQEAPRYSYDYRVRTSGISLPILPSIGFRMVF